jgi:hypothetical protein
MKLYSNISTDLFQEFPDLESPCLAYISVCGMILIQANTLPLLNSILPQELASLVIQKALGTRTNPIFSHAIIGIRGK